MTFTSNVWIDALIVSSLIFFNIFCFAGIFLLIFIVGAVNKLIHTVENTNKTIMEKLDTVEQSLVDWSWISGPVAGVLGSLFLGGKKKENKGWKRFLS